MMDDETLAKMDRLNTECELSQEDVADLIATVRSLRIANVAKSDYWRNEFNKQIAMDADSYEGFKRGVIWALDAACDYLCDNDLGSHQDRVRAIGKDLPK